MRHLSTLAFSQWPLPTLDSPTCLPQNYTTLDLPWLKLSYLSEADPGMLSFPLVLTGHLKPCSRTLFPLSLWASSQWPQGEGRPTLSNCYLLFWRETSLLLNVVLVGPRLVVPSSLKCGWNLASVMLHWVQILTDLWGILWLTPGSIPQ